MRDGEFRKNAAPPYTFTPEQIAKTLEAARAFFCPSPEERRENPQSEKPQPDLFTAPGVIKA
jgi:hypothetical protein